MEMYDFNNAKYNIRLQELKEEEARLERFLAENSTTMADYEVKRIKNTLTGIRVELEEIVQIMNGGFY
ncbi:hypothetical protein [Clostridium thermarum]|uniref:hypothetical protein n=1 Tax=Clostridium thermarum TaxID=1716543 RepID=UPI0013D023C7|nr:hypothetical protein [Clostridium thermarum]